MRSLRTLIAIALILLVQTMVLGRFERLQAIDLFLLFNVYYALNFSPLSCIAVSVTSGLIQDAFTGGIIGMNAFSKTIVAYSIAVLSSRLMIKHPFILMMLVAVSTGVDLLTINMLNRLFSLPQMVLSYQVFLTATILNMLVGLLGFHIADRIRTRMEYA
ncbi:rod shape-determining protein MreD [bacterium]|nr:rod shape-determining protein MreD [bacterium]MCI0603479.1 rod shape-determining protein MreD [bacterium]